MKLNSNIYIVFTLLLAGLLSFSASAQKVKILGLTQGDRASQIKAELTPEGKTLTGVTTYSYKLSDGASLRSTEYELVDGRYISASVDCWSGAYDAFQMRLTFSDGSSLLTECVDKDMTSAFFWLGDFPWYAAQSGWDADHPPRVDSSMENGIPIQVNSVVYYKGISNHAPGFIIYNTDSIASKLPEPYTGFDRLVTRYGVQDPQYYGNLIFEVLVDGTSQLRQTIYALTNTDRPADDPVVRDWSYPMDGVKTLRFSANPNGVNWGDHLEMPLARLTLNRQQWPTADNVTLSINNSGGSLEAPLELSSTLTNASGNVYYKIVSGSNLANIEGSTLVPVWGGKGEVIVEACYYGDELHKPVSDYAIFYVDMQPHIELLSLYQPTEEGNKARGYVLADTKGKKLDKLEIRTFNNYYELKPGTPVTLHPSGSYEILPFETEAGTDGVLQLAYRYAGDTEDTVTSYWQNGEYFDYMSDLPSVIVTGYGTAPQPNKPFSDASKNGVLELGSEPGSRKYAKGYSFHANGRVESNTDLSPYYRFSADMGGQLISNPTHTDQLKFSIRNGATYLLNETVVNFSDITPFESLINGQQQLIVNGSNNGNNTNAVATIGAPRLFLTPAIKTPQTITWESEKTFRINEDLSFTLDATAESGGDVYYKVVKGNASVDGNTLTLYAPDGREEVIVEAHQPGNEVWGVAPAAVCVFRLIRGLEVMRDESVTLKGNQKIDELIVHADNISSGQVNVKNGFAEVKTFILKFTFNPGEWTYICFPADIDLEQSSDFREKGFGLNNEFGPAYRVKKYDTQIRADRPYDDPWTTLTQPLLTGMKGYLIGIDNTTDNEPVEITFTIDNSRIDLSNHQTPVGLTLDLSGMQAGWKDKIFVTPTDGNGRVLGNTLEVDLTYSPSDSSSLPVNYQQALNDSRLTFVGDKKAMRITLPDQTPARVVIFDKGGSKVIKAIKYVSPMAIDLSGLKKGQYQVVVEYGNAIRTFPLEL